MKKYFDEKKATSRKLEDKFGTRSICLAKWYMANIHLQTGETHSCDHPSPHKIDPATLAENPSSLHNTAHKLEERRQMLRGERPPGCQYCWNIENLGESFISDRQNRTGWLYTENRVAEIEAVREGPNVVPHFIEVSFGNECNFRCGYCHPKVSSRYYDEIVKFGPYTDVKNHRCDIDWFKIHKEENNPYVTAWWTWWEKVQDQVQILRITGGEPLIQKSTYRLLESLNGNPKPHLELNINSNLGSSNVIIAKFVDQVKSLTANKAVKKFGLFTSLDTWGPQAAYIRNGLNLELFEKNLKYYLSNTTDLLTFMVTFNLFSVPNFDRFLAKILEWRREFPSHVSPRHQRVHFDIHYLKEPLQFDMQILPKDEFMPMMKRHLQFMVDNLDDNRKDKFSFLEVENFRRVVEYMDTTSYPEERVKEGRRDFAKFFAEQDRRRDTNLEQVFPELEKFSALCRETI